MIKWQWLKSVRWLSITIAMTVAISIVILVARFNSGRSDIGRYTHNEQIDQGSTVQPATYNGQINQGHMVQLDRELDGTVPKCVPHHNLMTREIKRGAHFLNAKPVNKTEFIPYTAYDYGDFAMVITTGDGFYGVPAVCRYFDKNTTELSPKCSSVVFPNLAVYCCHNANATYMSITLNSDDSVIKYLEIVNRTAKVAKYTLSACLTSLYGNESKWLYLAQLFEHSKLQGVSHFYVYVQEIDSYSRKLLLDYENTNEAELAYFDIDERPQEDWQRVAIQDCLGRSRFESKFITFADLDELFMTTNGTLLEYVRRTVLATVASVAVHPYMIERSSDPPTVYEGLPTLLENLPSLIFQNSSSKTYKFRIKPIFKPEKVIAMLVHWVYLFEPGYTWVNSSMDEVFILHYRDLYSDGFYERYREKMIQFEPFVSRPYPERMMQQLIYVMKDRLDCVYGEQPYFFKQ